MTDAGLAYLASPEVLATFLSAAYDSSLVQKSNFFRSVSPRPLCSELCFTTLAHSFGLQMTSNLGAGSEIVNAPSLDSYGKEQPILAENWH
jgi:hypothetical protein